MMKSLRDGAQALALPALGLAVWWLAARGAWVPRAYLPAPAAVLEALAIGLDRGALGAQTLATLQRMLLALGLATLVGTGLGVGVGHSARVREWLLPSLEFLRPLPASALLPPAIAVFGLSPLMVLGVVTLGATWPVLLATAHAVAQVPPRLQDVARMLGLGPWRTLWHITLPHARADILAALRLSLTIALIVSVVGEMLASQPGLGLHVLQAARAFRADELYAGIALMALMGLLGNAALATLARHLHPREPH